MNALKAGLVGIVTAAAATPFILLADLPNVFQDGGIIYADDVNANFSSLDDRISGFEDRFGPAGTASLRVESTDVVNQPLPLRIVDDPSALTFGQDTFGRQIRLSRADGHFTDLGLDVEGEFFISRAQSTDTALKVDADGRLALGSEDPDARFEIGYAGDNAPTDTFIKITNPTLQHSGSDQVLFEFSENNANYFRMWRPAWTGSNRGPIVLGGNKAPSPFVQIAMDQQNGNVGIGTLTPASTLHVAGTITEDSDARLKADITPIDGALDRLMQIDGVTFTWIDPVRGEGTQMGVIAQDVEAQFPELVVTAQSGYKAVNYNGLVAPLIQAVHEQQALIDAQRAEIDRLNAQVAELQALEGRMAKLERLLAAQGR